MKKTLKALIILLVIGVLAGCGEKKSEVADSDDWHDAQLIIHGTRFKDVGNMTVADIEKLGFEIDRTLLAVSMPSDLEPGKTAIVSTRSVDGSKELYDFRVVNKTGKSAPAEKCNIEGIYVIEPENKNDMLVGATDIFLANGVGLGMTPDEVRNIMGNPDEEKINDDQEKAYKTWIYNLNSNGSKIAMMFSKDKDTMNSLIIKY